jgi:DDE superfamily endonuclease
VDHQPRPCVCAKKQRRDWLIRLTAQQPDWGLGFMDETWWRRLAHPWLHTWSEPSPLQWLEKVVPTGDPDPKALCCDGLLRTDHNQGRLRFVEGRPVSRRTIAFLSWLCYPVALERKTVLVLSWDNASWHLSREVRTWIRSYHQRAKQSGGVRLLPCRLPVKSPWLNSLEPHWLHGKRAIVEQAHLLTAAEVIPRVCDYCAADYVPPLQQHVA